MEPILVDSWEEFQEKISKLEKINNSHINSSPVHHVSPFLFRGQANAEWKLETTLEREQSSQYSMLEYFNLMCTVSPQIQSLLETKWVLPKIDEYGKWLSEKKQRLQQPLEGYDFMAYLRHYRFPSPLLDWTRSPYIAAYFAFREPACPKKRVAIYVYQDFTENGRCGSTRIPYIQALGPYVPTHRRHVLQQSDYTICTVKHNSEWLYVPHEKTKYEQGENKLSKFSIPSTERMKVLNFLDRLNLNAFSLFGSEESLMEMLAFRELEYNSKTRNVG